MENENMKIESRLKPAQYVADCLDIPVHAVWRGAREGLWSFTVRVSPGRYKFDPVGLEEFIRNGGIDSGAKHTRAALAA